MCLLNIPSSVLTTWREDYSYVSHPAGAATDWPEAVSDRASESGRGDNKNHNRRRNSRRGGEKKKSEIIQP